MEIYTIRTKAGFGMPACAHAWHLGTDGSQLRTTGDVSVLQGTGVSADVIRDRAAAVAVATFPGTTAWSPPT